MPRLLSEEPSSVAARASNKALLRCAAVSSVERVAAARGPRDDTVASALPAAAAAALIRWVWLPSGRESSGSDDEESSVDGSNDESTSTQGRLHGCAAAAIGRLRMGAAGGGAALAAELRAVITVAAASAAGSTAALSLREWRRVARAPLRGARSRA